jgi:hypothetical protein
MKHWRKKLKILEDERLPYSWIIRIKTVKLDTLLKAIYGFDATPI